MHFVLCISMLYIVETSRHTLFLVYHDDNSFSWVVGVVVPLDRDMLYGACNNSQLDRHDDIARKKVHTKTFFALQILHAIFRTFPSARTTSGASSTPNLHSQPVSKQPQVHKGKQLELTSDEPQKRPS